MLNALFLYLHKSSTLLYQYKIEVKLILWIDGHMSKWRKNGWLNHNTAKKHILESSIQFGDTLLLRRAAQTTMLTEKHFVCRRSR